MADKPDYSMNTFADLKNYSPKNDQPETFKNIESKVKILKEMKKVLFNLLAS